MRAENNLNVSPQSIYYVINLQQDRWVQVSDQFNNLDDAKQAFQNLVRQYPFARLGGRKSALIKYSD